MTGATGIATIRATAPRTNTARRTRLPRWTDPGQRGNSWSCLCLTHAQNFVPTLAGHHKVELDAEVTVAMPSCGNYATTLTALQSLFLAAQDDFELLLIDNHSPDDSVRTLLQQARQEHENTTLFFFSENREYSGALNAILSHARGRWVIFLSNDIFVTTNYLREILAAARADPRHGIVRASSDFVGNGKPSHNIGLSRAPSSFEELFAVEKQIAEQYPAASVVDEFLTGDAFLVSRALLERIGTIDPVFFGYFADPDFGLRAQIAGFDQILVRRAFADHHQAANFSYLAKPLREQKLAERWSRVDQNWVRFQSKYGLPAGPYTSVHHIPWKVLASQAFDPAKHYVPPGDYLADRVTAA